MYIHLITLHLYLTKTLYSVILSTYKGVYMSELLKYIIVDTDLICAELSLQEAVLFSLLVTLNQQEKTDFREVTNRMLSDTLQVTNKTISKTLSKLAKKGLISIEVHRGKGVNLYRTITISDDF